MVTLCDLTDKEFINAKRFAIKTAKYHKDFSTTHIRSTDNKIENIRVGKLGEIAYRKIKQSELVDKDPLLDEGPCYYDFISNDGKSIDVKTLDEEWKNRIYINFDAHAPADIFVLILLNEKNKTGEYLGKLTKQELSSILKYDSQYDTYYVMKLNFKI